VTETVLLDAAERSSATLTALRAAGVRVSLDDFGTGYSSLTYLQKFPVDRIKIDQSFVRNVDSDAAANAIVLAMVDLARALGVGVTAEGVETAEQRDFLKKIGCDELQGFLLSHALSPEDVDRLLATREGATPAEVASAA
jgi:EAL domain-containing protein (putative c-di-GMP-specific phosphodiesterase class I)